MHTATHTTIVNRSLPDPGRGPGKLLTSDKALVAELAMLVKVLVAAVLATAVAFAWTGWNLFRSPSSNVTLSLGIGLLLTALCMATWLVAARAMFCCRKAALRDAALLETEARLRKERDLLRAIINNLPDYVYAKDREGRFVFNNIAHARSFGVQTPQELVGKSDLDFHPPELAQQFLADELRIIESEQPLINQEQHNIRSEHGGAGRWCTASKVLWRDPEGRVIGTVGITRDIHERKIAEDKLHLFTKQLERSNRELQDFAYVASHDLQEPLRKIIVFGERLKERCGETLAGDGADYLERMQKAATRMQSLINDLLSFSRVTTKARPFTPVNLAEVAAEVVYDLEGRIEQVKGRVELGEFPTIEADALMIRQLLQNLIGNALKFHQKDVTPVVKVSARMVEGANSVVPTCCRLTVSDNGIGFDEKYLDRIFNVFQRLHSRAEYEGTGMGLAIVRKIVSHHGGEVTAESQPGNGATFIVMLPTTHTEESGHTSIIK